MCYHFLTVSCLLKVLQILRQFTSLLAVVNCAWWGQCCSSILICCSPYVRFSLKLLTGTHTWIQQCDEKSFTSVWLSGARLICRIFWDVRQSYIELVLFIEVCNNNSKDWYEWSILSIFNNTMEMCSPNIQWRICIYFENAHQKVIHPHSL